MICLTKAAVSRSHFFGNPKHFQSVHLKERGGNRKDGQVMRTFWWKRAYKWVNSGSIRDHDNSVTIASKVRASHSGFLWLTDLRLQKKMYFSHIHLFTILLTCSPVTHYCGKANVQLEEPTALISFRLPLHTLPEFSVWAVNIYWSWPPLCQLYSSKSFSLIIKSDSAPFG